MSTHHLLSITAGHASDSLDGTWRSDPQDLVKGFLRGPFVAAEGTLHTYDNATTFVLARMVERATGRTLPELSRLSFTPVEGTLGPDRSVTATVDASADGSALPHGSCVAVEPVQGGWHVRLGASAVVTAGHLRWQESSPLGRPVVATGAWRDRTFVADLYIITTPHRVRLVIDTATGTATVTWSGIPLTSSDLLLHLTAPLMTRPDVA